VRDYEAGIATNTPLSSVTYPSNKIYR